LKAALWSENKVIKKFKGKIIGADLIQVKQKSFFG
jgi:hypothetical protein